MGYLVNDFGAELQVVTDGSYSYSVGYLYPSLGIVMDYGWLIFTPPMVCHILGVICTLSFIWFDHICCCCCDCCRGQQEVVVYDPDHPEASLVWRDGEVIEKKEEETENAETEM